MNNPHPLSSDDDWKFLIYCYLQLIELSVENFCRMKNNIRGTRGNG